MFFELIEYDDIKDIKKLYKNYIIDNNLPVDNDNSNSSDESDYEKKNQKNIQIQNLLIEMKKK